MSELDKAKQFLAKAHPTIFYHLDGMPTCEDIAGAGYDLAAQAGYEHENGCEFWEVETTQLPDGRISAGVVVSDDDGEGLGMLWVGRMIVEDGEDIFAIEEVSRVGLVDYDRHRGPHGDYAWRTD